MNNVEKIKPTGLFTNYIYKAIPLAFDESMSYYETLCGLLSYLKNTVIPALNNNADSIIEVQNLMTELQNYVDNYFDNLDVQQEINNKLDEMAQNGTLAEIIETFITPLSDKVINKGKILIEYPFLSYNMQGINGNYIVQGSVYYEKDNLKHIVVAMESGYNGPFYLIDFNLTSNSVNQYNVSSLFQGTGSLNSLEYDGQNNKILVLYNNLIYSINPDDFSLDTIYNTGINTSILGIAFDKNTNTLYGAAISNTKVDFYRLTYTSYEYINSIEFDYTNCRYYQDITISNNIIYITFSNNIVAVNLNNFEILGIYNSLLDYVEYESTIVMKDGSICPVMHPIDSHAVAITQTNLGSIYNGVLHPHISYTSGNHLYVNESAPGFLETGLSNKPIHSIQFASAYAQAYNIHDLYVIDNTTQGLSIRNYNIDITLANENVEFFIKSMINCKATISSGKIKANYITDSIVNFISTKFYDSVSCIKSDLLFNTFPENFFQYASFEFCTIKGNQTALGSMALFNNNSGYIDGSTANLNIQTGNPFNKFISNGLFMAEVSSTSNGTINGYIIMHNSKAHTGILSGSGANVNGEAVYVAINGSGQITCKIGNNQGYVQRIYPIHI